MFEKEILLRKRGDEKWQFTGSCRNVNSVTENQETDVTRFFNERGKSKPIISEKNQHIL